MTREGPPLYYKWGASGGRSTTGDGRSFYCICDGYNKLSIKDTLICEKTLTSGQISVPGIDSSETLFVTPR